MTLQGNFPQPPIRNPIHHDGTDAVHKDTKSADNDGISGMKTSLTTLVPETLIVNSILTSISRQQFLAKFSIHFSIVRSVVYTMLNHQTMSGCSWQPTAHADLLAHFLERHFAKISVYCQMYCIVLVAL